jgi:Tfp pilus assembly protein PilN
VKAVNLLPGDSRHRGGLAGVKVGHLGPLHVVLTVLVIVLAYVTLYVLTGNQISDHKAQLASLQQQVTQEQAQIATLGRFTQFEQLASQRAETVRQIAASRFDWYGALSDLARVMPANASLQSLLATVAPGVSASGAGGSTAGSAIGNGAVRGAINAPAFEIKGCTVTQDDVARLISRLRLINGVQRVTLEDSVKSNVSSAGASTTGATSAVGGISCPKNGPGFDLVVFFQALPGALTSPGSSQPASTSAPGPSAPATPVGPTK